MECGTDELGSLDNNSYMFVLNLPLTYFPAVDGLPFLHKQLEGIEILEFSALDDNLLLFAELTDIEHNESAQVAHLHFSQLQLTLLVFVGEERLVAWMNQLDMCHSREYLADKRSDVGFAPQEERFF